MNCEKRQKLIDRIAKLLAVTVDRGATEAEAATAAEAAKQLMDAYGIGSDDITATAARDKIVRINRKAAHNWVKAICVAVAKYFDCELVMWPPFTRVYIVGFEADAHTAAALHDAIVNQVKAAAVQAYTHDRLFTKHRNAFCRGAANVIQQRLQRMQQQHGSGAPSRHASSENALVIRDALADVIREETCGRSKDVAAGQGSRAGEAFGDQVSLDTNQLATKDRRQLT